MVGDIPTYGGVPALLPVPLAALRPTWAEIRPRVDELSTQASEPWVPEDVFHEILVGNAYLWAFPDCSGFVVLRILATGYTRDLFVWLGWKEGGDAAAALLPQMLEIARANDCNRITWESPREGFIRAIPRARRMYSYSVEVGDEQ